MAQVEINFRAIVLAVAAAQALGFIWYGKRAFGTKWAELAGVSLQQGGKGMLSAFIGTIGASFVTAFALSVVLSVLRVDGVGIGVGLAVLAWLGFVVTTALTNHLFAGRPTGQFLIEQGYHLLSLVLMGAIIGGWR